MIKRIGMVAGVMLASLAGLVHAEDRLQGETTVLGNRELPRVTYVVPWREFADEGLSLDTLRTEDMSLEVVDREVLRRTADYDALIQSEGRGKTP